MDEKSIIHRINRLSSALEFTNSASPSPNHFTTGERILIHQETAYLLNQLSTATIRAFQVPEEIERKIIHILK